MGVDADREWSSCNMDVNRMFMGDWMKNYQQELPDMLLDDVRVLVYAGDQDYICNWIGNKQWTLAMDWEHHDEYNAATDDAYRLSSGLEVGKIRSSNGFSFLQIYQAGHMVPRDQPEVALYMLNKFIGA